MRGAWMSPLVLAAAVPLGAAEGKPPASWYAAARTADGTLVWCDEHADRAELERRAWLAFELLGAVRLDLGCSDDARRMARLAAIPDWAAIVDDDLTAHPGAEALSSLDRALQAAHMASLPEHVASDGAMAVCNRCGAMWVPGPNRGAGPVTWRILRLRLAEFAQRHRPCGVARPDGRVRLAPRSPAAGAAASEPPRLPYARPRASVRLYLRAEPARLAARLGPEL